MEYTGGSPCINRVLFLAATFLEHKNETCLLSLSRKEKRERGVFSFKFPFSYRRLQVEFSSSIW